MRWALGLALALAGCFITPADVDPVAQNAAGALRADIVRWNLVTYRAGRNVVFPQLADSVLGGIDTSLAALVTDLSGVMISAGGQFGSLRTPTLVSATEATWDSGSQHLGIGVAAPRAWHFEVSGRTLITGTLDAAGDTFAVDALEAGAAGQLQVRTGSDGGLPFVEVTQVTGGHTLHHRSATVGSFGVLTAATSFEVVDGAGVLHGAIRWQPDQSGRADVTLGGGGHAIECWGTAWIQTYYLDGEGGAPVGDVAMCPPGAPASPDAGPGLR